MIHKFAHRRLLLAGVPALVLLASASALCPVDDAIDAIRQRRRLRIGYAVEPPYAYVDRNGLVTGEGPDTAQLIAAHLGWGVEWIQTEFDALIPQLLDGRFDVIASGLFVTAEREQLVRFAAPQLRVAPGLLVRAGAAGIPQSYAQLQAAGDKRIAVVEGSVEAAAVRGLSPSRIVRVPDAQAGATAVQNELVDALTLSWPTVRRLAAARAGPRAVRLDAADGGALVAAAFRPADHRLRAAWNTAQAAVLGSPPHLEVLARHGFDAADLPQGGRQP